MLNIKIKATVFIFAAIVGISAFDISAADINTYYTSDDGGVYFVRQIGNKFYWFGEKSNGSYANIVAGTVNGSKVTGKYWDVPKGRSQGGGDITLEITGNGNEIKIVSTSKPFLTKILKIGKTGNCNVPGTAVQIPCERFALVDTLSKPEGFRFGEDNLTGVWNGDDYATYYVRHSDGGDVVWFAENNFADEDSSNKPPFAYIFVGKKINNLVTGEWVTVSKGRTNGNGSLFVNTADKQNIKFLNPPQGIYANTIQRSLPNNLRGFADLHTHPMVHLALGRKFIHGAPDVGSIIPADENCKMNYRVQTISQALGRDNSTHGGTGWFGVDNRCGDNLRQGILDAFQEQNGAVVTPDNAVGYPSFKDYPKWNDLTHQKMWVDWIRRAYNGGQRVMIALAMNNQTLASAISGPGDGPVTDKESADLQIEEMKSFAKRHNDFMEIAYSSADVRRIVSQNKMAVILGIEIDNIGNFINFRQNPKGSAVGEYQDNTTSIATEAEIDRLYKNGVRYVFPVHLIDNLYGGTAIYQDLFNLSNYHIRHKYWKIECSQKGDGITKKFKVSGFDVTLAAAKALKLGIDIANFPPDPPACNSPNTGNGHVNGDGFGVLGDTLINKLMSKGMLIDIDHSSIKTINGIFRMAEAVPGGYPLVSGHTGLREDLKNENSRTPEQLARISKLGGMFGLGSDDVSADTWTKQYVKATTQMGDLLGGKVAFGSDLNGLVKGPPPRSGADIYNLFFQRSHTGDKYWNYRTEGVAHYGMLTDFLRDIKITQGKNGTLVNDSLMRNAEVFAQMWEKAEKYGKRKTGK